MAAFLFLAAAPLETPAQISKIYWVNMSSPSISRANPDGSDVEVILTQPQGAGYPQFIDIDAAGGKMYWADGGAGSAVDTCEPLRYSTSSLCREIRKPKYAARLPRRFRSLEVALMYDRHLSSISGCLEHPQK